MKEILVEKGNFTVTFNDVFNAEIDGKKLTLEAWGLYVFMLSLPEDWDYSINGLATQVNAGKDKIQRVINELIKFGFIHRKRLRKKGSFGGFQYTIRRRPKLPYPENPVMVENKPAETVKNTNENDKSNGSPYPGLPYTVNPPQQSTKETKIDKRIDKGETVTVYPHSVNIHFLTKELIDKNFINAIDYDFELFNDFLFEADKKYHWEIVLRVVRYVVDYYFKNSDDITNKFGWFKAAVNNNSAMIMEAIKNNPNHKLKTKKKSKNWHTEKPDIDELPDWFADYENKMRLKWEQGIGE